MFFNILICKTYISSLKTALITAISEIMADFHAHNILIFLKHVFKLNEDNGCIHHTCPDKIKCSQNLGEDQIDLYLQTYKPILVKLINDAPQGRTFITICRQAGHTTMMQAGRLTKINYYLICKLLPDTLYFLIEGDRVYASFEENYDAIAISDFSRMITYCPQPEFKSCRNRDISSISTIFENQILEQMDPDLLKRYLAHKSTEISLSFKKRLVCANHNNNLKKL
jgi:hypothetical protein